MIPNRFRPTPLAAALFLASALPAAIPMPLHAQAAEPTGKAAGKAARSGDQGSNPNVSETTLPEVKSTAPALLETQPSSPKYTAPLVDTPQTVTIVPREVIQERGATNLRDVLRNVPGISMQAGEGGAPAGDQLSIRGFSSRTDIFVDNVRDFGGYTRDPFNLEQVEVIKGPASSYSGRGSTGGSINLVSKAPRLESFINADVGLGSDSYRRLTLDVNQPLESLGDGTAFRLNLLAHDADTPGRDVADTRRWGVAPSLALGLNTSTRVTLSYFHLDQDNMPDYGLPWVPNTNVPLAGYADRPAPVDFDNYYGLKARDYEKVETDIATVQIEHDFNDHARVRNLTRWGRTDRDSIITAPRFASTASTDIRRSDWKSRDQTDTIVVNQTDFTFDFTTGGVRHTLVTGLEFARETEKNFTRAATGPSSPNTDLYDPDPDDPYTEDIQRTGTAARSGTDSTAVYVFDTARLSEQWELTGGLRWDRVSTDFTSAAGVDFERVDSMTSWRAAVVYKPLPTGSIYFGYGTSFNPSAEGLTLTASTAALSPEKSRTWELGTKWELFGQRALLSAAIFRTDKTNARTPGLPGDPPTVLEGKQRVEGFELGLSGRLTAAWQVFAGYTCMDSEILRSNTAAEVGNQMTNTPENSFSLWSTYDVTRDLQVGIGAQYVDDRFSNAINTRVAPDYWVYDAMATYRVNDNLSLRLNVLNLTDKRYIDYIGGGHFIPGEGRAVRLTASFSY